MIYRLMQLLLAILAACAVAEHSHALEPPYLEGWPSADRVLEDTQGKAGLDTMARQMAALELLRRSIEGLAGPRLWSGLTPDEEWLRGEYWSAAKKIETEAKSRLSNQLGPGFHGPFARSPLQQWYDLQWEYEQDPEFRATTLARYLPPALLVRLDAQGSASDARRAESGDRIGWRAAIPAVIAFLVLALVVRAWRRRSARRDVARAPAFEDTAEERGPQQVYVAAAKEVVDTLAPYFAAAQRDGRPIPAGVLSDPGIHAFLVAYSQAAFAALTGVDREKVDIDDALEVLHEIQTSQRQRLPLEGPMPTWATLKAKVEDDAGYVVSRLEAQGALDTFAGEEYILADLDVLTVEDSELEGVQLRDNPPATRLHPRGPHAGLGQRLVLRALSKNVARLAAEPT